MSEETSGDSSPSIRVTANYLERFERYECQELLAYNSTHWLLSPEFVSKVTTDQPLGLVSQLQNFNDTSCLFLIPEDENIAPLDFRELHQIIRELTIGIFALHQVPTISLEANFDQSTVCQLPPVYHDTRVGQIMINVDYMMKSLWHGAYMPKDKRAKFSERWSRMKTEDKVDAKTPMLAQFIASGLYDITKDPDFEHIYDKLPIDQPGDPEMAEERRFFMSHVDDLSMQLVAFQKSVMQYTNLFVLDADWLVSSKVQLTEDKIDPIGYERLNSRLQLHQGVIKDALTNKAEIRRQLCLLKFISFMVPFLIALKKKMKIPDLNKMLPPMTGEECKTERELPPLILSQDFRCKNFNFGNMYFNLHGGVLFDSETDNPVLPPQAVIDEHSNIMQQAATTNNKVLDPEQPLQESYPVPVKEIDGKRYYVFSIETEMFYQAASPMKPRWVEKMIDEAGSLTPKRLPLSDVQTHEQLKKYYGYKRAIKYKKGKEKDQLNIPVGLRAASIRGLVSIFATLTRKCPPSRLSKQDEAGLSLVHYAAMFNRPQIIALLILQSMDINVRRNNNILSTGPTPLHLACRCGSLDVVSFLVANFANILVMDQNGQAPIHYAAYFNHEPVIRLLVRKYETLLELTTQNELKSTPLLLAASSGALDAVKCLISIGANIKKQDDANNNMVHLAALRFHTNVLEYFIVWNHKDVDVWKTLVEMLQSESYQKKDSAVRCLEVLSTAAPSHWISILDAGGIPALVNLLKIDSEELQSVAASVLCNISEHEPIRSALAKANAATILIKLLGSPIDDIHSRCSIVLSDLACVEDHQTVIAQQGGILPLVSLLDSELEDVLVNAVNAIRVMCTGNRDNQSAVALHNGIEPLVEFLTVPSEILQAASSAAIASLAASHKENQDAIVAEGAVRPIVDLIKGRNVTVPVKAASALEALAQDNPNSQKAFLELDAPKALIKLLKIWSLQVKEQGACALWALAGHTKTQQKDIAERIGIQQLIDMLLLKSEKLQYVGCMAITALCRESMDNQNKIADESGIQPLVRLIRSPKTSERVLLTSIKTLGTLCVGVAHRNNKITQSKIAEDNAIPIMVQLLLAPPSDEIQVEVACALGCIVLGNTANQDILKEQPGFDFRILLTLLDSKNQNIRLRAGLALAVFAFNNTPQQYGIREAGGIKYGIFKQFLESEDEFYRCHGAFQIVVLARVIMEANQVSLSAEGVTILVEILKSKEDNAVILAASLLSSLAHTRAGIPDAMVTSGAVDLLIDNLSSENVQVRGATAVALGYLTFNKTAARMLLVACRNTPGLYDKLDDNIGKDAKISPEFVDDFRRAKIVGLPSQSLEVNGGPPACPPRKRVDGRRPTTSMSMHNHGYRSIDTRANRAASAPAHVNRAQTARSVHTRKDRNVTPITKPHNDGFTKQSAA